MAETVKGWYRLPVSEKKLKEEVDGYFERCARDESPPTPSGLALALGVRTSALSDARLSPVQRAVIDRAMQRIEASTMELMLTKGGVKGMESILERVKEGDEKARAQEAVRGMADEELEGRLKRVAVEIWEVLSPDGSVRDG